ncbi:MAG: class II aldolase [Spirochaetales bacterium]|nr:class II aldolase [Spirochaetales bacterium]
MSDNLADLIEVSRTYGSDPDWVLAGGGNTSMKEDGFLYVKASGFELATIGAEGFVKMSLDKLDAVWNKNYPADEKLREAGVLEDMMNARTEGQGARPSVEALLHSLIKGRLVVHTHPALINGLTCGVGGEAALKEIFGDAALWVPLTHPGYILANEIKTRLDAAAASGKPYPEMIFLQNHGLFVAGETPFDIERLQKKAAAGITGRLVKTAVGDSGTRSIAQSVSGSFPEEAERAWGRKLTVLGAVNTDVLAFAESAESFEKIRLPLNPDQIVYCGPGPLRIDSLSGLSAAVSAYKSEWKREPQGVLLKGVGAFAVGDNDKKAESALALLLDSVRIAVYSESFGGALPMTDELIIFIRDWEVEHYRAKVSK